MEDKQIKRTQSRYDEEIERKTSDIKRKCRTDIARLMDQAEREINWMQYERRSAMYREIHDLLQCDAGNELGDIAL